MNAALNFPVMCTPDRRSGVLPLPPPTEDPSLESFEHCFDLLKYDWVWDFFFSSDASLIDQLQFSLTRMSSLPVHMSFRTVEGSMSDAWPPSASGLPAALDERSNLLLLPSFSTGSISVGFGVVESMESINPCLSRSCYFGRVARDDRAGTLLFMSDDPSLGLTEVTYIRLLSPAYRDQRYINFHYDKFQAAVKSLRGGAYNHLAMRDALLLYINMTDTRPCPTCDSLPSAAACGCPVALRPKKHPCDDTAEMNNLSLYLGGYTGVYNLGLYSDPLVPSLAVRCLYEHSNTLITDPAVRDRLAHWALCNAAQNNALVLSGSAFQLRFSPSIRVGVLPPLQAFMLSAIIDRAEQLALTEKSYNLPSAIKVLWDRFPKALIKMPRESNELASSTLSVEAGTESASMGISENGFGEDKRFRNNASVSQDSWLTSFLDPNDKFESSSTQNISAHLNPLDIDPKLGSLDLMDSMALVVSSVEMRDKHLFSKISSLSDLPTTPLAPAVPISPSPIPAVPPVPSISTAPPIPPIPGVPAIPAIPAFPALPVALHSATSMAAQGVVHLPSALSPGLAGPRAAVALAPAKVSSPSGSGGEDALSDGADAVALVDERQRKAEIRKARNREAAHRSNQKRKLQMTHLREELELANSTESMLRAHEKMLREENKLLRLQTAETRR